jgi:hypothetical protein
MAMHSAHYTRSPLVTSVFVPLQVIITGLSLSRFELYYNSSIFFSYLVLSDIGPFPSMRKIFVST